MAETLIIADLHLAKPDPRTLALLDTFLERAKDAEAVYLLGDLFDYWIGDDQPLDPAIAERLERFASLPGPVTFQSGNRDFLVGNALLERLGAKRLPDQFVLEHGGRRLLLTHGDELCVDDPAYQAMRAQLRDPAFVRDFLARSLEERIAIAEGLRSKSKTASSSKPEDIMDVNAAAVEEILERTGADGLIHGHTHRPAIHRLDGGRPRVVTGDWGESGWLVALEGDGLTLERFTPEATEIMATWPPGKET
ncbi:UDP-2,3-diacylglucosamine diphosphatase [Guyparkeria hydrothermalis]|uniref:UDP-2,3-diacylglucosamine diphosphatase n=1 Tax=Guyparkeria hydrothermalis TaxID=923 RepID=UPI0020221380|nr:UDP-2,3-diacylglucosamine diphosphatase [Guyparkeria hydrothermalis]MCL7743855.1 UDP-2,3-diacylglucosamine diphosphatase [Guyparkeria hydrothermalis]